MDWFKKRVSPAHSLWKDCNCKACTDYKNQLLVELNIVRTILEMYSA